MDFFGSPFSVLGVKKIMRKTGEVVEVIASDIKDNGARSDGDWVSYIDSYGVEHIKEHLNLQFDFKDEDTWQARMDKLLEEAKGIDRWEQRRYELVKEMVIEKGWTLDTAFSVAEEIISTLKKYPEATEFVEGVQMDDGYDNIGIGEIVESIDGAEHLKKFVFTDRKDIVGFRGDSGRWAVGDKVKVYIKEFEPKKGL
jgi:hypothetical protein